MTVSNFIKYTPYMMINTLYKRLNKFILLFILYLIKDGTTACATVLTQLKTDGKVYNMQL